MDLALKKPYKGWYAIKPNKPNQTNRKKLCHFASINKFRFLDHVWIDYPHKNLANIEIE